jgi:hypothetical protein
MGLILVDCPNGNLVIGYFDAQIIIEWDILKPIHWNYNLDLVSSFHENNGCIVFIQRVNVNFVGQVKACAKGSFTYELDENMLKYIKKVVLTCKKTRIYDKYIRK